MAPVVGSGSIPAWMAFVPNFILKGSEESNVAQALERLA